MPLLRVSCLISIGYGRNWVRYGAISAGFVHITNAVVCFLLALGLWFVFIMRFLEIIMCNTRMEFFWSCLKAGCGDAELMGRAFAVSHPSYQNKGVATVGRPDGK
jgi:hypothetical protein